MAKKRSAESATPATPDAPPAASEDAVPFGGSTAVMEPAIPEGYRAWQGAFMCPIDKLVFTDWNVNEMSDGDFSELVAEIEDDGFDEPIAVIPLKDKPGHFLVPSGEHRARAARSLGMSEIPAVLKRKLSEADEAEIKMWSVRRNHIKGSVNVAKFKALEKNLSEKHKIQTDVARRRMLVKDDLLAKLRPPEEKKPREPNDSPDSDAGDNKTNDAGDQRRLLNALKSAEKEVLLQSADSVKHGYLWFEQGSGKHLVVDASSNLHGRVQAMVKHCKKDQARVDEFLSAAIAAELAKREGPAAGEQAGEGDDA